MQELIFEGGGNQTINTVVCGCPLPNETGGIIVNIYFVATIKM